MKSTTNSQKLSLTTALCSSLTVILTLAIVRLLYIQASSDNSNNLHVSRKHVAAVAVTPATPSSSTSQQQDGGNSVANVTVTPANLFSDSNRQSVLLTHTRYELMHQIALNRLLHHSKSSRSSGSSSSRSNSSSSSNNSSNNIAYNDMFLYLSLADDNCSSLTVAEAQQALTNTHYYRAMKQRFDAKVAETPVDEGYSAQLDGQAAFYTLLASQPWVRQICEVGFNAGHSAFYWLAANNRTRLLSFDLGIHPYSKKMADFLSDLFPDRLRIVWGDSTQTVPQLVASLKAENMSLSCDVIVLDGGHDYPIAVADLRNMRAFVTSPLNVVIMDDTPCVAFWCEGPTKAWLELRTHIKPLMGCVHMTDVRRGFSVGYYVV
jgi:hypothetical protein